MERTEMNIQDYMMKHREAYLTANPEANSSINDWYISHRIPAVKCADGFRISVQAHAGAYCSPRINKGPWEQVECGYPSSKPDEIISYCENPEAPCNTVYGYVPIEKVQELLDAHGGIVE